MGMRIGARVQINTAVVADQNLISIGDDTVIGGDVTLVGHVAERGRLTAAPVVIGKRVTVGLMAVIFPGCVIGDGAVLAAGSVLTKNTKIGAGEIWSGVPARRVGRRRTSARATTCSRGSAAGCRPGSSGRPPSAGTWRGSCGTGTGTRGRKICLRLQ